MIPIELSKRDRGRLAPTRRRELSESLVGTVHFAAAREAVQSRHLALACEHGAAVL